MSAIEVMHTFDQHHVTTHHPLLMVIWPNEEGAFTGSGGATGRLEPDDLARVNNGISITDGIQKIGGDSSRLAEARLPAGAISKYVSRRLERKGSIG